MKQDIGDINKPKFTWRTGNDSDHKNEIHGLEASLRCEDPSLTVQSFMEDADLNVIARRFGLESIPIGPLDPSMFRDTTQDPDLREILHRNLEAKQYFMALPAKLRSRFHNNMAELWDFVTDPDNAEEAIRLGLLTAPAPAPAEPVNTSTGTSPSTPTTGAQGTKTPPESPPNKGDQKATP